jgi:hypothetical protein
LSADDSNVDRKGSGKRYKKSKWTKEELRLKEVEALRLRVEEQKSYQEIADLEDWPTGEAARRGIDRALSRNTGTNIEEKRANHIARLERMLADIRPLMDEERHLIEEVEVEGDKGVTISRRRKNTQLEATQMGLKIMAEIRKYEPGLEVPTKNELTGADGAALPFIVQMTMPAPDPGTKVVDQEDLSK